MMWFTDGLNERDICSFRCCSQIYADIHLGDKAISQILQAKRKSKSCESECNQVRSFTLGLIPLLCGSRTCPSITRKTTTEHRKTLGLEDHGPFGAWLWAFNRLDKVAVPQPSDVIPCYQVRVPHWVIVNLPMFKGSIVIFEGIYPSSIVE